MFNLFKKSGKIKNIKHYRLDNGYIKTKAVLCNYIIPSILDVILYYLLYIEYLFLFDNKASNNFYYILTSKALTRLYIYILIIAFKNKNICINRNENFNLKSLIILVFSILVFYVVLTIDVFVISESKNIEFSSTINIKSKNIIIISQSKIANKINKIYDVHADYYKYTKDYDNTISNVLIVSIFTIKSIALAIKYAYQQNIFLKKYAHPLNSLGIQSIFNLLFCVLFITVINIIKCNSNIFDFIVDFNVRFKLNLNSHSNSIGNLISYNYLNDYNLFKNNLISSIEIYFSKKMILKICLLTMLAFLSFMYKYIDIILSNNVSPITRYISDCIEYIPLIILSILTNITFKFYLFLLYIINAF